jgi:hypothetical protein
MHSPISNTQTVVLEKKFIQNQINIIVENKLKHVIATKIKKYYMFWGKKMMREYKYVYQLRFT